MTRILGAATCAVLLAPLLSGRPLATGGTCGELAKLALPDTVITSALPVDAGAFAPPPPASPEGFRDLPAFCRVRATLRPSKDSEIKMEAWLPSSGWNGKFEAVGNGAFNGSMAYPALAAALARGYAASSTDTGHEGGSASFALGHPEKAIDFGWRAVHETAVTSKRIIAAHFDTAPKFSLLEWLFGRRAAGMKEAQRFPADFDGIVAGAPGMDWTGRAAQAVRVAQALEASDAARLLRPQRELLHPLVVETCDALDGVKDGLIENPSRCKADPAALQCKADGDTACLTAAQVGTARLIYSSVPNPRSKREIAGLERGGELGWTDLGWTASARATGLDQFRFLVFRDPKWVLSSFTFDTDIVRAEETDADTINALDPNLRPFIDRGGKLIQYHGWSDPQIPPGASTQYYGRVVDSLGSSVKVQDSYRLFMAPGMAHCGGGEGPNTFDMMAALEQWVEHGRAPDRILAAHRTNNTVDRTRPLCPFPQVAVYRGTGSIDDAASFTCSAR